MQAGLFLTDTGRADDDVETFKIDGIQIAVASSSPMSLQLTVELELIDATICSLAAHCRYGCAPSNGGVSTVALMDNMVICERNVEICSDSSRSYSYLLSPWRLC